MPRYKYRVEMLRKKQIKQINKDGYYWAEGPVVMANHGDTHTYTFCMCRSHQEARDVARAINVLDHIENQ